MVDAEDYRNYGMLNQFHAQQLNEKAERCLRKSIALGEGRSLSFRADVTVSEASEGQLGYLLRSLGRNQENIDKYEQAVKDEPERVYNWYGLIDAYAAEDPEKALALAKECLVKFPGDDGLFFMCGDTCRKMEKFDEAEGYYKQAVEANPDNGSSYYNMAFMYTEMKEHEKAIWAWEQVITLCGRLGLADEEAEMNREWPRREIAKLRAKPLLG